MERLDYQHIGHVFPQTLLAEFNCITQLFHHAIVAKEDATMFL